jgi:diguanylate cyclase (GGDEF)-like protein
MNESRTDELTQINNRYALYDFFDTEDKSSKVLAIFDIDDFKHVNDKYGHVVGDHILKRVAEIATRVLDDSFVCRYGGEEFVVILEENNFLNRLEQLRNAVEKETMEIENAKIKVTITIGAVNHLKDLSLEEWVELADEKMYTGKNTGKNKTVI